MSLIPGTSIDSYHINNFIPKISSYGVYIRIGKTIPWNSGSDHVYMTLWYGISADRIIQTRIVPCQWQLHTCVIAKVDQLSVPLSKHTVPAWIVKPCRLEQSSRGTVASGRTHPSEIYMYHWGLGTESLCAVQTVVTCKTGIISSHDKQNLKYRQNNAIKLMWCPVW